MNLYPLQSKKKKEANPGKNVKNQGIIVKMPWIHEHIQNRNGIFVDNAH